MNFFQRMLPRRLSVKSVRVKPMSRPGVSTVNNRPINMRILYSHIGRFFIDGNQDFTMDTNIEAKVEESSPALTLPTTDLLAGQYQLVGCIP